MKRVYLRKLVLIIVHLIAILFLAGPCPAEMDMNEQWRSLLDSKQADLKRMSEAVDWSAIALPRQWPAVHKRLLILDARLDLLIWDYYGSKESPFALQDLLINIGRITKQTETMLHPFRSRLASLKQDEELAVETLREMDKHCLVIEAVISRQLFEKTRKYEEDLEKARIKTSKIITRLEEELKPADRFLMRMENQKSLLLSRFDESLLHYFSEPMPNFFSLAGWKSVIEKTGQWYDNSYRKWTYPMGEHHSILFDALAASVIIIILFGLIGRRLLKIIEGRAQKKDIVRLFFPFVFWTSVSIAVIAAGNTLYLNSDSLFSLLLAGPFFAALVSLSWNLRRINNTSLLGKSNHLIGIWAVFTTGNALMILSFPSEAGAPAWVLVLMAISFYYWRSRNIQLPMLERRLCGILPFALAALALISVLGWANLTYLMSALFFVIVISIHLTYGIVTMMGAHREAVGEDSDGHSLAGVFSLVLNAPLVFLVIFYALTALAVMAAGGGSLLHRLVDLKIGWEKLHFPLVRAPLIVGLFFLTRSVMALTHEILTRLPGRMDNIDEGEILSLKTISTYVYWLLFFMTALYALGFNLGHIALIGGGLTVGIGFGMQNIINNFVSGIILLLGRSLKPGDLVEIEDLTGLIEKVTIRNTLVRTADGTSVFVPNSQLVSKKFVNLSHQNPRLRIQISIPVAYGNDPQNIMDILLKVVQANDEVLKDPRPSASLVELGRSCMQYSASFWVENFKKMGITSQIRRDIEAALRKEGIALPVRMPVEIEPFFPTDKVTGSPG